MGLSVWQILIIVAVVVLLFGANRIPRLMRDMGSGSTAFKKGLKDEDKDGDAKEDTPAIKDESGAATTTAAKTAAEKEPVKKA